MQVQLFHDPAAVRVTAEMKGGNLLVCVLWVKRETTCDEDNYRVRGGDGWRERERDEISVEVTVALPQGVKVDASTVNGGLDIDGATAAVQARTVNGSITARSTGGPVQAKTVNGGIRVRAGALGDGDLAYETVNGGITVELPAATDARIEARTVNGGIESEFPVTVQGSLRRNRLSGHKDASARPGGRARQRGADRRGSARSSSRRWCRAGSCGPRRPDRARPEIGG